MALSPQALIKGLVAKLLASSPNIDSQNIDVALRLLSYGELAVQPMVRKNHLLVDEGSYFTANNAQSGLAITPAAAFAATTPFLLVFNANPAGGKSIYLDYLALITTAAGSAASGLTLIQAAAVVDIGNRLSSAGTALTAKNANMLSNQGSGAVITAGAPVATAASSSARTLVGLRSLRPTVSGTVADVVGESKLMNFGGVEGGSAGSITIANANIIPIPMPALVIPPQCSGLIYVFYAAAGTPVAASYAPELGYFER